MRQRLLILTTTLAIAACGGGGGGGSKTKAPSGLSYGSPDARYLVQVAIVENLPTVKGKVKSWSIAPALPAGLALDPQTGAITGTPSDTWPRTAHVVTAKGPGGQAKAVVHVSVDKPPRFAYAVGTEDDTLSAFVVDAWSGGLRAHGYQPHGASRPGPQQLVFHPNGLFAFAPNRGQTQQTSTVSSYAVDPDTGRLTHLGEVAAGERPERLALAPDGATLYALSGVDSRVRSFAVDAGTGALTLLTDQQTNTGPERLAADPLGRFLYVTHGPSADVTIFHVDPLTGALGPFVDGINYWGFEPTDVVIDPSGEHAYIAFEIINTLLAYDIDPVTGALRTAAEVPMTALPRDLAIPAHGGYLYVVNEDADTLSIYTLDEDTGVPTLLEDVTVGDAPVHVEFDESGQYLYVLNDGSNDVSVFTVDVVSGGLTPAGTIRTRASAATFAVYGGPRPALPRAEFLYVVNEESDDVAGFTIDAQSGDLTSTGGNTLTGDSPEAVAADPLGRFVFVANRVDQNVSVYSITPGSGVLVEAPGREALGATPGGVAVDPSGRYLLVTLEGPRDVVAFAIDGTGALTETDRAATAPMPRGVAVDPTGQFVYVANVGGAAHTLSSFRFAEGAFVGARTDTAAPGSPSAPRFAPSGERLFVALRTADLLVPYAIDPDSGALTIDPAGSEATSTQPSVVEPHPNGTLAFAAVPGAALEAGHLARLTVDGTGALTTLGTTPQGLSPVDLRCDPSGGFLFTVNQDGDDLMVFAVDTATGDLTLLDQSPAGLAPRALVVTQRVD